MTKILVECPVCENRIEIASGQKNEKTIRCDLCNNSFEIQANRIKEDAAPAVAKPVQVRDQPKEAVPPAQPAAPTQSALEATPSIASSTVSSTGDPFAVARSTKARAMLKRKKSPIIPILLGIAALGSAIALITVIVVVDPFRKPAPKQDELALNEEDLNSDSESEGENSDDPKASIATAQKSGDPDADSVFRADGESDEVEMPPTNAPPDKPPKSPSYRIIRKGDVQKFWDNQFWHFVRLRVDTGDESHYVSGTIVDSRGWVVTSLSAVANAKEIEVQSADSNLREFNGVRIKPTDLVRGVIKTDVGSDLVLLSINREFVLSPTGVNFGKSDSLVGSQNVIQCACPGTENWAWPRETQLEGRKSYDDLDFDFQSQFEEQKLDKAITFILHSGYTDTAMGASLFSEKGDLLGINTGLSDESSMMLAAPVEKLMELISSSEDKPMSLSTLAR